MEKNETIEELSCPDEENSIYVIVKSMNDDLDTEILGMFYDYNGACSFMLSWVDDNYPNDKWRNIYHDDKETISIYDLGFVSKSLFCKIHILKYRFDL